MTTPRARNENLRLAIEQAGLTYTQLATEVRRIAAEAGDPLRTNQSAVSHWVAGRPPSPTTAAYIAEVLSRRLGRHLTPDDFGWQGPAQSEIGSDALLGLGIGPDPVDIVRRIGEADINRRKILTGAAYCVAAAALPLGLATAAEAQDRGARARGRRVGASDIATVRSMLEAFTAIDERQGGQHGRSAVVQYLRSDVADITRAARDADRVDALTAAAAVTYLCGWKAYDAGEHGLSQRYYLQSFGLTREAENPLQSAWLLRIMAHNGLDLRQPAHTLALAENALSLATGRAGPGLLSLFVICHARALGRAGRGAEAAAEIRRAQDLAMRGEAEAEELPFWAALSGAPRAGVASHTAKTFRSLRDHANAERQYAAAARGYGRPADGKSRITALSLAWQGEEQAKQGHLEQACGTWDKALGLFDGVYSTRAAKQVAGIRRQLGVFERRGVVAAAQLDERARTWQLAHA
ncbi:helix-turn-helix domain-containing protein [Streptomyces sp. NBC_01207]|uniref:helix-turn-helix domain-containing protein n=1 Tax=Streptomyces sp. NBC_01207 TaxID=2903772 RepID=UPI002E117A81|nr:helix-turn-helix domain-containing protein [Streptomyces sp. NBC_01207]